MGPLHRRLLCFSPPQRTAAAASGTAAVGEGRGACWATPGPWRAPPSTPRMSTPYSPAQARRGAFWLLWNRRVSFYIPSKVRCILWSLGAGFPRGSEKCRGSAYCCVDWGCRAAPNLTHVQDLYIPWSYSHCRLLYYRKGRGWWGISPKKKFVARPCSSHISG